MTGELTMYLHRLLYSDALGLHVCVIFELPLLMELHEPADEKALERGLMGLIS